MDTMPQDPSNWQLVFVAVAALSTRERGWNMGQGHRINNRTVKFVVSCCVVSEQLEVSTILVSVESTGTWLHAGTCPVFVRYVVLEIYRVFFCFFFFSVKYAS